MLQGKTTLSSNGFRIDAEDSAKIADLRKQAEAFKVQGDNESAWRCQAQAARIIGRVSLERIQAGEYESDEELYFIGPPETFAQAKEDRRGVRLTLLMLEGTPIVNQIVELLTKILDGKEYGGV